MVAAPTGPALAVFSADGANIPGVPAAPAGPPGVTFTGAQIGTWELIDEHRIHFTGVQLLAGANGAFVGSVTIDGHPQVSDDGRSRRAQRQRASIPETRPDAERWTGHVG